MSIYYVSAIVRCIPDFFLFMFTSLEDRSRFERQNKATLREIVRLSCRKIQVNLKAETIEDV